MSKLLGWVLSSPKALVVAERLHGWTRESLTRMAASRNVTSVVTACYIRTFSFLSSKQQPFPVESKGPPSKPFGQTYHVYSRGVHVSLAKETLFGGCRLWNCLKHVSDSWLHMSRIVWLCWLRSLSFCFSLCSGCSIAEQQCQPVFSSAGQGPNSTALWIASPSLRGRRTRCRRFCKTSFCSFWPPLLHQVHSALCWRCFGWTVGISNSWLGRGAQLFRSSCML